MDRRSLSMFRAPRALCARYLAGDQDGTHPGMPEPDRSSFEAHDEWRRRCISIWTVALPLIGAISPAGCDRGVRWTTPEADATPPRSGVAGAETKPSPKKRPVAGPVLEITPATAKRRVPIPARQLSPTEEAIIGTWIAVVDERATKVNGDERLVLPMDPNLTPLDAMRAAVESQPTRCIWLEFYPDFSGFRYACRVVEDVTTPLAIIDRRTNESTPLGARFSWTPSVLGTPEMEFEERLILPASLDGKRPESEVRHWRLEYAGRDDNGSRMSEFFAETGFLSDFVYTWTIRNDFI